MQDSSLWKNENANFMLLKMSVNMLPMAYVKHEIHIFLCNIIIEESLSPLYPRSVAGLAGDRRVRMPRLTNMTIEPFHSFLFFQNSCYSACFESSLYFVSFIVNIPTRKMLFEHSNSIVICKKRDWNSSFTGCYPTGSTDTLMWMSS